MAVYLSGLKLLNLIIKNTKEKKSWQYFLYFPPPYTIRKVRTDDTVVCLKTATPVKMYKYLYIYIGELLYIIHGIKYCIDKHSTKPDYLHIPALYRFNNNRYKIRGFCVYREIQHHFKHGSTHPHPRTQCHQGFIAVSF